MNPVLIDANLLLLLIVGTASRSYITMHKRLAAYTENDFDVLQKLLRRRFSRIIVLPHILTEVSNLAAQIHTTAKRHIRMVLAEFISRTEEQQILSARAVAHPSFLDLGLTDAAILLASNPTEGRPTILTADLDLAIAAEIAGMQVVNFNHLRAD